MAPGCPGGARVHPDDQTVMTDPYRLLNVPRTADTGTVDLSTVMVTLEAADTLTTIGGFDVLAAAVQESFTSTAPTDHVARIADKAAVDARRRALQQAAAALDDGQDLDTNRAFLMDALASTSATAATLGRASPRKPRVSMASRSLSGASLLVA